MSHKQHVGYTQQAILTSLSNGGDKTIRDLSADWPWLTAESTRSSLDRLYVRKYVEPAGWDGPSRLWSITSRGMEALDEIGEVE